MGWWCDLVGWSWDFVAESPKPREQRQGAHTHKVKAGRTERGEDAHTHRVRTPKMGGMMERRMRRRSGAIRARILLRRSLSASDMGGSQSLMNLYFLSSRVCVCGGEGDRG
jgi:hypothetical protein